MRFSRRMILRWGAVLLAAALIVWAAAAFLQEQLRPCAPLDLALRRSSCLRVIDLPNLIGTSYVSAAPNGRYVAVTATSAENGSQTVLVIDLETERVVEEYSLGEIESQRGEEFATPYAIYSPDGRLTRDYQDRKRITSVNTSDGERLISFTERYPCHYIAIVEFEGEVETIVREIPIRWSPQLAQLALSHDDSRLAVGRSRLAAWDLATGAALIDLGTGSLFANTGDMTDVDWLPDNRTLVVGLFGRPARIALFELPDAAPTPDQSAAPQCQPETDEVRRHWR